MKKVGLIIFGVVVAVFLFNRVLDVQIISSLMQGMGGSAVHDLSDCKPLPEQYDVEVVTVEEQYALAARRYIRFTAENVEDASPYLVGYGTYDTEHHYPQGYVKLGLDASNIIAHNDGTVSIDFGEYQPTIFAGDDYMGVRVFDKHSCYNVDVTPFKETEWIVVMIPPERATLHESILTKGTTTIPFEDCAFCRQLATLEPATIIYVHTWNAAKELLEQGNVSALIIDNSDGTTYSELSMWERVDQKELRQFFEQKASEIIGISVPTTYANALGVEKDAPMFGNFSADIGGLWVWYPHNANDATTGNDTLIDLLSDTFDLRQE